ncbi:SUKH-4 family immunity protein [Streptomyces sp. NBC_00536]|uniref:SUKH-4 family immunity protein n=1 Tax=Streptomyces sp. NBC_00536 TaxID=2975769 RepID=UPI002E81EE8F|nr:SUKH-4 family immunity protein [Streptomyces sp. NBC_00536]WUC83087.1 SUKH-4 family immunity protein [Streptomyces sp. NBC_00536]
MQVNIDWPVVVERAAPGDLLRFRPDAAARIWPDGGGARFVTDVGIPYSNGLFRILEELADPDPASPETAFDTGLSAEAVDTPHGRLQPLGVVFQSAVFVHLGDGTIWARDPDSEIEYELIHQDVSSLGYLVYKFEVERPGPEERPSPYDWADVEEIVREGMERWDALPFASAFWMSFLHSYPML